MKGTDLTKKPKCVDELLNEVEIYKVLAKLQGIYIPELLFYGNVANGMSFVVGMTIVGTTLGHHKIDRRLKNRAIDALKKVHRYNMTLEYTMIEPCRTLLKFFEKFHRTVVQISFLGDHV